MDWGLIGGFAVGLALGGGFVYLLLATRLRDSRADRDALQKARSDLNEANVRVGKLETALEDRQALEARMEERFTSLAADALRENRDELVKTAGMIYDSKLKENTLDIQARQERIATLLKPLTDKLDTSERDRKGTDHSITRLTASIAELRGEIDETQELNRGLHSLFRDPTKRGGLGEELFERLLQDCGFIKGTHYVLQPTEDGKRPDCHVMLPDDLVFVVDMKWPHDAYEAAIKCESDSERKECLKRFVRQMRETVSRLARKDYASEFEHKMVYMYLPNEASYMTALGVDHELDRFAREQGVLICTPTTMFLHLQHANYLWRQRRIEQNSEQIVALGKKMVERILVVVDHLEGVRNGLHSAVGAFNKAIGSIDSRLYSTAREFDELGIETEKALPEELEPVDAPDREYTKPELISQPELR